MAQGQALPSKLPPSALAPYRVLDLTGDLGALTARMLADLGADVIKVEPPDGDPARLVGPFYGGALHPAKSLRWLFFNANKRGITLNLCRAEGQELLRRLVSTADFLVESYVPGYLDSLGLGYAELSRLDPALIVVSITPWGQRGPYAEFKSSDLVAWAMGGHMELAGDLDRPPVRISYPNSWSLAGAHGAAGAMMAQMARLKSGLGQHVDVSAQESVTWTLMIAAQTWDISHINPRRGGAVRTMNRLGQTALSSRMIWPCADGYVLWTLSGGTQAGAVASMHALVDWMKTEGKAEGLEEFAWQGFAAAGIDQETYDRLAAPFQRFFLSKTKGELFEGAVARSIQLAPVGNPIDHYESPQFAERRFFEAVEHPELGLTLRFPGAPVRLSATPWRLACPAPALGQDNAAVYGELLGLTAAEIEALRREGTI